MEILSVNNLGYYYKDGEDKRVIFDGVNVSFEEGRMYVLLGESGSGKTTFLSIIGGQDKRYTGTVKYMGKDIKNIGLDKYRRTAVSTIYQNYNLFTYLNSIENIELAMDISENVRKPNKQAIIRTLDKLGIDEKKAKRKTSSLSGGEQQRAAIARSIMTDSMIIIADEPTGNLDYKSADEVISYLRQLADNGKCVIMVTHNEKYTEAADVVLRIDQEKKTIRYDTLAKR